MASFAFTVAHLPRLLGPDAIAAGHVGLDQFDSPDFDAGEPIHLQPAQALLKRFIDRFIGGQADERLLLGPTIAIAHQFNPMLRPGSWAAALSTVIEYAGSVDAGRRSG